MNEENTNEDMTEQSGDIPESGSAEVVVPEVVAHEVFVINDEGSNEESSAGDHTSQFVHRFVFNP